MARKSNKNPEKVLKVAAGLFESRGYQGTTMDDVADGVGLNKGTIYHYFDSKAAILFQIYTTAQELILRAIEDIPPDLAAEETLRKLIRAQLSVMESNPSETVVYHQEKRWIKEWLDAEQHRAIREREQVFTKFVADLIQRGIDEGAFVIADPKITAFGLIGVTAWSYQWYDPKGRLSIDEVGDVFEKLLLNGLRGGPSATVSSTKA